MAEINMTPEQVGADLKSRLENELREYETEVLMLEARMRDTPGSPSKNLQDRLEAAKENLQRVRGALGSPKMKEGGMAGSKRTPHMYVGGGAVVDNLPNKGLRKLAQSPKGRQAVRKMGFDV